MRVSWGITFIACLITGVLFGQSDSDLETFSDLFPESSIDPEIWIQLEQMRKVPLDLNSCLMADLIQIPGIDEVLARRILKHREISGAYQSLYELQVIQGMQPELFRWMIQFVGIATLQSQSQKEKGEYLLFLQPSSKQRDGFKRNIYRGSIWKQRHHLRWTSKKGWSLAFTADQDAGEAFLWDGKQKGFDFYSAYFQYNSEKWTCILGDYRVQLGQGLLLGNSMGFGSALWVAAPYKSQRISPYSGSDEQFFFRGIATEFRSSVFTQRLFISYRKVDGDVFGLPSSVSGFHRSESEWAKRKQAQTGMVTYGIDYTGNQGTFGMNLLIQKWGKAINGGGSFHYKYRRKNQLYFGELASDGKVFMMLSGCLVSLGNGLDLGLVFRAYPRENPFYRSGAYSSFSTAENERGLSFRISGKWWNWKLNASQDIVYRPYPSYLHDKGYWKQQRFVEGEKKLAGMGVKWRWIWQQGMRQGEETERNGKAHAAERLVKYRLDLIKEIDAWRFKFRAEQCRYSAFGKADGFLVYQEFRWKPEASPMAITLRFTRFQISDYAARIYAYEPDVLYAFSVPGFQGNGFKLVALFHLKTRHLGDFWLKSSLLKIHHTNTYGSGYDTYSGSVLPELKMLYLKRF